MTMPFALVDGHRIEYEWSSYTNDARSAIVLLHEGLGSIAMWKDFPEQLARACERSVLTFSRYGYGKSDPLTHARRVDFMHDEALQALPQLLDQLNIQSPVLVGHSDGGSIALIHASTSGRAVAGVVVMAPHVKVEDVSIRSIEAAKVAYETTDLRAKLARYHDDPDSAFRGWNDIWLHPEFRAWNIESLLPGIACPVLAIQGHDDEYGTMEQIDSIVRNTPHASSLKLDQCRHSPHRDQTERVLSSIRDFCNSLEVLR